MKTKTRIRIGVATFSLAVATYVMFCSLVTDVQQAVDLSPKAHPAAALGTLALFTAIHIFIESMVESN